MSKLIFSTRILPEAAAATAAAAGCRLLQADVLQFDYTEAHQQTADLEAMVRQPLHVVLTSAQAVYALLAALPEASPRWTIACCGAHTAELIRQRFPHSSLQTMAPNAATLADKLLQASPDVSWLYLCGRQRLEVLPTAFAAAGRPLQECRVYQTRLIPVKLPAIADGVLFFSPSTVAAFLAANDWPAKALAVCMGHTTAQALRSKVPEAQVLLAATATKWGALETALQQLNQD